MKKIDIDKWGWVKKSIPIFFLAGLALIFFSDAIFQNKVFIHRDLGRFFYPLREFSARELLSGKIPLWDPFINCGSPHLAELQTCVFYPLSIIYLVLPYPYAFNYFIIIHIALAGIFVYMLMKEWGYSGYASFLSASVFMFSGYIISVINLLASLASVIWLPLVILFYERALKKDWVKNSVITGIFMTLMFLGGEPVVLYATVFILIILSLTFYGRERFETVPYRGRWGRPFLLTSAVFLGLASFQILPFLEFLRYSSRSAMGFKEASMWSLPPYALLDLFIPYLSESDYIYKDYWGRQSWLLAYYMGITTVIFAAISMKFDTTKRRRAIFYILALGLVLSFGRYTPIYYILYNFLPGFRFSRYPVKFFFMAAFSLAILAGMGMEYCRRHIKTDLSLQRFLRQVLTLGFILSFFYLIFNLNFQAVFNLFQDALSNIGLDIAGKKDHVHQLLYAGLSNIKRGIGFFMVLSVVIFFGIKKKANLNIALFIILIIALSDVFFANRNVYQNMGQKEFLKPAGTIEFLKNDSSLFRIFNSPGALRRNMFVPERDYFDGMRGLKERAVSNLGVIYGIYDAYGYGSIYNKRHEEVIDSIVKSKMPDETNLLNLLNVKYVISPKEFKANGYKIVRKSEKANIYENENVLARAFLADKAVVIKDEKKILEKMKSEEFIPEKEVILEEVLDSSFDKLRTRSNNIARSFAPLLQYSSSERVSREESVSVLKYEPSYVEIEAVVDESKFLILSDTYYPGWKAHVDGKLDKIYRADYILRAVYLKPGKHIVKFTYDPFSFKMGAIITLGTIFVIMSLITGRERF